MKKLLAFLSLFTSLGTLLCCALPSLLVVLGMGAVMAGLVTQFPQLVWLSEHKVLVFSTAGVFLVLAGVFQYRARHQACPTDSDLRDACQTSRGFSFWVYIFSVIVFFIGLFFATR